ncbi:MAG: YjgN family protein [Chitinispirillia bacterium]|nr:YjgN family protein [Chitinispirillia bacterium]MCL2269292.1 YjgN family protein [Chitinispirillia bacterium]
MSEQKSYFDGGVLDFIGWSIVCLLIVVCTFGLCFPWALCLFAKWAFSHTVIDGRRLQFSGSGMSLFGNYILWWFLTIITFGIYSFWLFNAVMKWAVKNISFAELTPANQ